MRNAWPRALHLGHSDRRRSPWLILQGTGDPGDRGTNRRATELRNGTVHLARDSPWYEPGASPIDAGAGAITGVAPRVSRRDFHERSRTPPARADGQNVDAPAVVSSTWPRSPAVRLRARPKGGAFSRCAKKGSFEAADSGPQSRVSTAHVLGAAPVGANTGRLLPAAPAAPTGETPGVNARPTAAVGAVGEALRNRARRRRARSASECGVGCWTAARPRVGPGPDHRTAAHVRPPKHGRRGRSSTPASPHPGTLDGASQRAIRREGCERQERPGY